jgi:adenosine deaminase
MEGHPEFEYGIIVCALRKFSPTYSKYYERLFNLHPYSRERDLYTMASLDLARAAVQIRDKFGIPIVGFDLAGEEAGYPAEHHAAAFELAHRNFLKKTVHAGEAYGPESIFQAITDLKADRIGHGYFLFQVTSIQDREILDKERFVRDLAGYIADRRVTIEVCLTSNLQTNPRIGALENHAFSRMREAKLSTTLCTDNRTVSRTTVSGEIRKGIEAFRLSERELRHIIVYGFKRSFFPRPYIEKRTYVRGVIDYYDRVQMRFREAAGAAAGTPR